MNAKKLSKEQLSSLATQLESLYGSVHLMCDGYRVTLRVERTAVMKFRVITYVNGEWCGKWMMGRESHPEQKFLRKSVVPNISRAKRAKLEKALGKKYIKNDPFWSGSITTYAVDWASGKAALSHLNRVCDSIELAPEEQPSAAKESS